MVLVLFHYFLFFFGKFNGKIQCLCFEEVGDRGVGRLVCRNRGFFDSIEIGEVVVEGSVRLLGRDCGNIGISGEEVIWVVIEDVPRVVFI